MSFGNAPRQVVFHVPAPVGPKRDKKNASIGPDDADDLKQPLLEEFNLKKYLKKKNIPLKYS